MKIPPEIIDKFEQSATGLDYGSVTLSLSVKQGKCRCIIAREESILLDENSSAKDDTQVDKKKIKALSKKS